MGTNEILEIKGRVIHWLALYPRTSSEVKKKLVSKGYRDIDIGQAIKELKAKKYLDDAEYAIRWVRQQLKNRPCGRILCKSLMLKRGISENIINEVLQREYSDRKELRIASELAQEKQKKLSRNKKITSDKLKQKLGYYLKNKGFTVSVIIDIIDNH